jgi:hypothetical protein
MGHRGENVRLRIRGRLLVDILDCRQYKVLCQKRLERIAMTDLIEVLPSRARRGSKPRCHLLTHGSDEEVAARLTSLVAPFAQISRDDHWMPRGFTDLEEGQLHKTAGLLNPEISAQLRDWWLAPASRRAMTPNFDIASTCTVGGTPGILLVEAKAHEEELAKETVGRRLTIDPGEDQELFKDR